MAILSSTGFYGFLSSCAKDGVKYLSNFKKGIAGIGRGWRLGRDEKNTSKYTLELDRVEVRDHLRSTDFTGQASEMSENGFNLETNYQGISGYSYMELDEVYVRKRAVFKEVVIEQLNSIAGGLVISAAHGKIAAVKDGMYEGSSSCFVVLDDGAPPADQDMNNNSGGSGPNRSEDPYGSSDPNSSSGSGSSSPGSGSTDTSPAFVRGDMVLCERADYNEGAGRFEKKRYWMLVEKSGLTGDSTCPLPDNLKAAGARYLILSYEQCEPRGGSPAVGDVLVQFGYIKEYGSLTVEMDIKDRQRAIIISQLTNMRAAFVEYHGIGASRPYFEIDEKKHEVTRICGKGNNKFTGSFSVLSESGETVDLGQQFTNLKNLTDEVFRDGIVTQAEKAALITELESLRQYKIEIDTTARSLKSFLIVKDVTEYKKLDEAHLAMSKAFDTLEEKIKEADKLSLKELRDAHDGYVASYSTYMQALEAAYAFIRSSTQTQIDSSDKMFSDLYSSVDFEVGDKSITQVVQKLALNTVNGELAHFHTTIDQLPDLISLKASRQTIVNNLDNLKQERIRIESLAGPLLKSLENRDSDAYRKYKNAYDDMESMFNQLDEVMGNSEQISLEDLGEFREIFQATYSLYIKAQEEGLAFFRDSTADNADFAMENFTAIYQDAGIEITPGKISSAVMALGINGVNKEIEQYCSGIDQLPNAISMSVKGEQKEAGLEIYLKKDDEGKVLEGHIEMQADKVKILNGGTTAALFENGKLNANFIDAASILVGTQISVGDYSVDPDQDLCPDLENITKKYEEIPYYKHDFSNDFLLRSGELNISLKDYKNALSKGKNSVICKIDSVVDTYNYRSFILTFNNAYVEKNGDFDDYKTAYTSCVFCQVGISLKYDLNDASVVLGSCMYEKMNFSGGNGISVRGLSVSPSYMELNGAKRLISEVPQGAELYYTISIFPYYQRDSYSEKKPIYYHLENAEVFLGNYKPTNVLISGTMTKFFKDGFFCYKSPLNYFYYRIGDRLEVKVSEEEVSSNLSSINAKKISGYRILLNEQIEGTGNTTVCVPQMIRSTSYGPAYFNVSTEATSQGTVQSFYSSEFFN